PAQDRLARRRRLGQRPRRAPGRRPCPSALSADTDPPSATCREGRQDGRALTRTRTGRFWPTPLQEQLLLAALGDPEDAAAAWRGLPPSFSLDELEPGSFELMPLIYRNLSSAGHRDSVLPRLKGIYRRTWARNNLLLERTREDADALRMAGIPALLLEGVTLALRYYPDLGSRPTTYLHFVVGKDDEVAAVARLERIGW